MLISDTSLMKTRSMTVVAQEIEAFREMTGQLKDYGSQSNPLGLSPLDITPMAMVCRHTGS